MEGFTERFTVPAGTLTLIANENPSRSGLWIWVRSGTDVEIIPYAEVGDTQGVFVGAGEGWPFTNLTGPVYAYSAGGAVLTVVAEGTQVTQVAG